MTCIEIDFCMWQLRYFTFLYKYVEHAFVLQGGIIS